MLASSPMLMLSPVDRLLAFLADAAHSGFGTFTTSPAGDSAEVTFKPQTGEDFKAFAARVLAYAGDNPVEWHIQAGKVPLARVLRKLS